MFFKLEFLKEKKFKKFLDNLKVFCHNIFAMIIDYSKVKCGWEIEFLIPKDKKPLFLHDRGFAQAGSFKRDGSVYSKRKIHKDYQDTEFVTKVFKFNEVEKSAFLLDIFARNGAITNETTGLHYHISFNPRWPSDNNFSSAQYKLFLSKLKDFFQPFKVFKYRQQYCKYSGRYQPVRSVSDYDQHFEIRIFNGVLNPRAFKHNVRQIKKAMDKIAAEIN